MTLDGWIEGRGGPHFTLPNAREKHDPPCPQEANCESCEEPMMDADYTPDDAERYDNEVECDHQCDGCGRYPVYHLRGYGENCPDEILCEGCEDARAEERENGVTDKAE